MLQPQVIINPLITTLAQILYLIFLPNQFNNLSHCLLLKCPSLCSSLPSFLLSFLPSSLHYSITFSLPPSLSSSSPSSLNSSLHSSLTTQVFPLTSSSLSFPFHPHSLVFFPVSFHSPFIPPINSP